VVRCARCGIVRWKIDYVLHLRQRVLSAGVDGRMLHRGDGSPFAVEC